MMDLRLTTNKRKGGQFGRREVSAVEQLRMIEELRAMEKTLWEQCPELNHEQIEEKHQPVVG